MNKLIKTTAVVFASLFTFTANSDARIGWTKDECNRKYGKDCNIYKEDGGNTYVVDNVAITCYFTSDGKCGSVVYQPLDVHNVAKPKSSFLFFVKLAKLNFGEGVAKWTPEPDTEDVYMSPDKTSCIVFSDKASNGEYRKLVLFTSKYLEELTKSKEKSTKNKIRKF
jgi:hypothetical protein